MSIRTEHCAITFYNNNSNKPKGHMMVFDEEDLSNIVSLFEEQKEKLDHTFEYNNLTYKASRKIKVKSRSKKDYPFYQLVMLLNVKEGGDPASILLCDFFIFSFPEEYLKQEKH